MVVFVFGLSLKCSLFFIFVYNNVRSTIWSTPCLGLWLRYCATTLLRLGRPTSEPMVGLNRLRHSAYYLVLFWYFLLSPYTEIIQVLGPSSRNLKVPTFLFFFVLYGQSNLKRFLTWEYQTPWNPTGETGPCRTKCSGPRSLDSRRRKKIQLEIQNEEPIISGCLVD